MSETKIKTVRFLSKPERVWLVDGVGESEKWIDLVYTLESELADGLADGGRKTLQNEIKVNYIWAVIKTVINLIRVKYSTQSKQPYCESLSTTRSPDHLRNCKVPKYVCSAGGETKEEKNSETDKG